MKQLIYILFGWALTAIVSWCAGKLLLRRLSLYLARQEEEVFAFLVGSACLSTAVFLMAALHLVYRATFLGLSIIVIAGALHGRRISADPERSREHSLCTTNRQKAFRLRLKPHIFGGSVTVEGRAMSHPGVAIASSTTGAAVARSEADHDGRRLM